MLLSLEEWASLTLAMLERVGCSSQPVHTQETDTMSSLVYVSNGAPVLGSVLREPFISSWGQRHRTEVCVSFAHPPLLYRHAP